MQSDKRETRGGPRTVGGAKGRRRHAASASQAPKELLTVRLHRSPGRGVGFAAAIGVLQSGGDQFEWVAHARQEIALPAKGAAGADRLLAEAARKFGRGVRWGPLSQILAAAGHADRLKIMSRLLEGPATYRGLQHATGLQVGPLYHHIDKLRLAGLMAPKERDLYALTPLGRNLVLIAATMTPFLGQRAARRKLTP